MDPESINEKEIGSPLGDLKEIKKKGLGPLPQQGEHEGKKAAMGGRNGVGIRVRKLLSVRGRGEV